MNDLFDEVPAAQEFCLDVEENAASYRLFDEEQFSELRCGVMSSTAVDLQGECFSNS